MADEGFHEIQLGKKQLLFVGMAAALYSVVVFSLGVWVGQDVRRPESEVAAEATPDTPAETTPEPTKVAPNELDYAARLGDGKAAPATPPATDTKPVEPPTPPESEVPKTTTPAKTEAPKAAPPPAEKAATPVKTPPPAAAKSGGVILQVGAFGDAKTAQNLANRLKGKGYAAFVFDAETGPSRYRVRVGPLADKAEVDKVSARLKKEEGFSPFPVPR
jgi:DedD protein